MHTSSKTDLLLIPDIIFRKVVSISAPTPDMVLQFLNNVIGIKTKVNLPGV